VWKLPVIFFCENNLYGEGTPQSQQAAVADLAVRAASYGFPGVTIDGNDVLAVYSATAEAAERARAGGGPTLIEAKTYRTRGHYEGDPQVYRSVEEIEMWKGKDPILRFRQRLVSSGRLSDAELEELEGSVLMQLDEAVKFAANAAKPALEDALKGVYADTHDGMVF
jgi:pyruvate dehydrogenase E1 component alpha subunit